jgi:hypothetical protein
MAIVFSKEDEAYIEAQAIEKGYSSAVEYIMALIEVDVEEDNLDEEDDPVEAFREAWHDAMTGNTRPAEEVLAEMRARRDHKG